LLVLGLACGLSFLLYLHRYTWGIIKEDVQKEFGWNTVTLGWMDGLFALSYGVGQVPSGMLCDWFGARLLLGGSVLLWSLALAVGGAAAGGPRHDRRGGVPGAIPQYAARASVGQPGGGRPRHRGRPGSGLCPPLAPQLAGAVAQPERRVPLPALHRQQHGRCP